MWTEHTDRVRPEWLDYNGHLNLAYYVVVFDGGTDAWQEAAGLGADYRTQSGCSIFAVEAHTQYRREVQGLAALTVRTRRVGGDAKRVHLAHVMYKDGEVVAMQEVLFLHVSLVTRRVMPMADGLAASVAATTGEEALPEWLGRRLGPWPPAELG